MISFNFVVYLYIRQTTSTEATTILITIKSAEVTCTAPVSKIEFSILLAAIRFGELLLFNTATKSNIICFTVGLYCK